MSFVLDKLIARGENGDLMLDADIAARLGALVSDFSRSTRRLRAVQA